MNVLVTGVSRYVGAHLAVRLAAHPRVDRVIGFDTVTPPAELRDLLTENGVESVTSTRWPIWACSPPPPRVAGQP